jgi:hypothetical protein
MSSSAYSQTIPSVSSFGTFPDLFRLSSTTQHLTQIRSLRTTLQTQQQQQKTGNEGGSITTEGVTYEEQFEATPAEEFEEENENVLEEEEFDWELGLTRNDPPSSTLPYHYPRYQDNLETYSLR